MKMKFTSFILTTIFLTSIFCINVSAAPSSWAITEVNTAKQLGIVPTKIMDDYRNPITREEFCEMSVLLYEKITKTTPTVAENPFTDINNPAVTSAFTLGIVNGVDVGLFAPHSLITRQEICAMLTRTIQATSPDIVIGDYPNTFPDISSISDWALKSVKYMNILEVMLGDEEGKINPQANTTREQAILLAYRTKVYSSTDSSNFLESYGFVNSGNSSNNMINGAFSINYTDNNLYLHDSKGIYIHNSASLIIDEPVDYMYISSYYIYYIKNSDKKLYFKPMPAGNEKVLSDIKASGITTANNDIYFKSTNDSQIYFVSAKGGTAQRISDNTKTYGIPISAGNTIAFASQEAIYSYHIPSGETSILYNGFASDLCLNNSIFYFKNAEGLICSINTSGGNYKVITKIPAITYCINQSGIAFTSLEGLYKSNLAGTFSIKIDDSNYVALNSYNKYIYAKTSDGSIIKIKNDLSEKTKLN